MTLHVAPAVGSPDAVAPAGIFSDAVSDVPAAPVVSRQDPLVVGDTGCTWAPRAENAAAANNLRGDAGQFDVQPVPPSGIWLADPLTDRTIVFQTTLLTNSNDRQGFVLLYPDAAERWEGYVLNNGGTGSSGLRVGWLDGNSAPVRAPNGRLEIQGVIGGVVRLEIDRDTRLCKFWSNYPSVDAAEYDEQDLTAANGFVEYDGDYFGWWHQDSASGTPKWGPIRYGPGGSF